MRLLPGDADAEPSPWARAVAAAFAAALLLDVEALREAITDLDGQELGRLQHAAEILTRECGRARWRQR